MVNTYHNYARFFTTLIFMNFCDNQENFIRKNCSSILYNKLLEQRRLGRYICLFTTYNLLKWIATKYLAYHTLVMNGGTVWCIFYYPQKTLAKDTPAPLISYGHHCHKALSSSHIVIREVLGNRKLSQAMKWCVLQWCLQGPSPFTVE